MTAVNKLGKTLSYLFLIIMAFLSVFPLYWMMVSATNTSMDVSAGRLLPGLALMDNMKDIMRQMNLWQCLWNSFKISIITTLICVTVSSCAGYAFEIYNDKYKDRLMAVLLIGVMIPGVATMIPLYKMISTWKVLDTMWACILPSITSIFLIFLFRQSTRNFPMEVVQAARVDGLSELGIFFRIYFPMMRSTYATAFILTFMGSWNNYMWPRIVLIDNDQATMPLLINSLLTGYSPNFGAVLLGCTMCTLPILVMFLSMQKAFANGISGSVKG